MAEGVAEGRVPLRIRREGARRPLEAGARRLGLGRVELLDQVLGTDPVVVGDVGRRAAAQEGADALPSIALGGEVDGGVALGVLGVDQLLHEGGLVRHPQLVQDVVQVVSRTRMGVHPAVHNGGVVDGRGAGRVPGVDGAEELLEHQREGLLLVAVGEADGPHERRLAAGVAGHQVRAKSLELLDDVDVAHGRSPVERGIAVLVDGPVGLEVRRRVGGV
ncbi:hypothetical protein VTK73DRAFT_6907 [Phialemonium thermophilum]|uniref:Uncharacterized protein n=1 Tax=Phialemonium thermophilum TaxID=223376 RepID=A0ABR3WIC6_9PEZI